RQNLSELCGSFTAEGHAGLRKLERQGEIGRDSIKLRAEDFLYALELFLGLRFESKHQHRGGVRCTHQAPALRVIDSHAVESGDVGFTPMGVAMQRLDDGELALLS